MQPTRPLVVPGRRCPCDCDGNGELVYLSCPRCGKVVQACDEIGNVFDDLSDPLASTPLVLWRSAGQKCPGCEEVSLAGFQLATEEDLTRAGVGRDDFDAGDMRSADRVRSLASG